MNNTSFSQRKKQGTKAEKLIEKYMTRNGPKYNYKFRHTGSEVVFPLDATNQFRIDPLFNPYRYMPDFLITPDVQGVFWIEVKSQSRSKKRSCSIEKEAFEWYIKLDTHTPVFIAVVAGSDLKAFLYRVSDIVFLEAEWIDGKKCGSGSPNFFNFIDAKKSKVTKVINLGDEE